MRLYTLAGRRHEALRQYQRCVNALAADLDIPPDPATEALYAQIVGGEIIAMSPVRAVSRVPDAVEA